MPVAFSNGECSMAYVPGFANDVFISYSHIDDQAVSGPGWVSDFHRRLLIEIEEELGLRASIWRDPRIGPATDFSRDLDRQLRGSAVLLAVLSPGYVNSSWCEWELGGFAGARRLGDLWIDTRCRVIKIVKRPADLSRLRVLSETGFADFFETDHATGQTYESSSESDLFKRKLTEISREIGIVLRAMRKTRTVYLGAAPAAQRDQRDRLRLELETRGFRTLSSADAADPEQKETLRSTVREASLSILFHDRIAAADPAGRLAAGERAAANDEHARQIVVVRGQPEGASLGWDELSSQPGASNVEWLIEPAIHVLCHTILQTLGTPVEDIAQPPSVPPPEPVGAVTATDAPPIRRLVRVYLICDRNDHPLLQPNRARHLRDHLLKLGFEVKLPLAEDADAGEFSRDNRTKLRQCDGVLLYWGSARQGWFDHRIGELMQARGWRHGRDFAVVGAYVADPPNPVKQNYETREVDELIKQFDILDLTDARLVRFVDRLGQA
jgi:hypothetical protein